mmetsp:Transcript_4591/g.12879  ORF Transcript_4591/g.12879 Transcript_4591/m.12879 type:complete len:298 (-) Transcript_4591:930-1823(-)
MIVEGILGDEIQQRRDESRRRGRIDPPPQLLQQSELHAGNVLGLELAVGQIHERAEAEAVGGRGPVRIPVGGRGLEGRRPPHLEGHVEGRHGGEVVRPRVDGDSALPVAGGATPAAVVAGSIVIVIVVTILRRRESPSPSQSQSLFLVLLQRGDVQIQHGQARRYGLPIVLKVIDDAVAPVGDAGSPLRRLSAVRFFAPRKGFGGRRRGGAERGVAASLEVRRAAAAGGVVFRLGPEEGEEGVLGNGGRGGGRGRRLRGVDRTAADEGRDDERRGRRRWFLDARRHFVRTETSGEQG